MSNAIEQNALYPIREVARLTGVNPITLRAWERRYNLVEPVRTESGHRLYTQEHIDFLHETLRLMDEGVPISRVKSVISDVTPRPVPVTAAVSSDDSQQLLEKICQAVSQLQVQKLERLLDRLFADYSLNAMRIVLAEIEQQLQRNENNTVLFAFWQSSLIRRLQVRLHSLHCQPLLPSKRIVIQKAPHSSAYLTKLVALFCFEQGYQPIEFDEMVSLEQVFASAKPLAVQAVIFIDDKADSGAQWLQCFKKYASMRTWVFGNEALADIQPPSVNCELRVCAHWFTPLNL